MDGNSIAFLGELLTYAGDWERGLALAARAKQLNPHHPGWYWYADFYNAYRQGDYRGALGFALKIKFPAIGLCTRRWPPATGNSENMMPPSKALQALLKLRPDFANTIRKDIEKWWEPDYGKHFIDGLRKAGLEIPPTEGEDARRAVRRSLPVPARRLWEPERILGGRIALYIQREQRGSPSLGRRLDRRHRHRPVSILLSQGDRAQLDFALRQ